MDEHHSVCSRQREGSAGMKLFEGIGIFELEDVVGDEKRVYRPTVIWDDKDVILVDTGLPGHFEEIRDHVEKISGHRLNKIIISHQDYDHLGSLSEVINGFDHKIEVYAHELTKPYIQGEEPLIKTGVTVPEIRVDHTISDGQVLPFCGGMSIIFTPGHTPDHISLYHHSTKTLIACDALTANQGKLLYPNAVYTLDMEQAIQSLSRFQDYDIDHVICFHGGVCSDHIKESLSILAAGKKILEK
jgi:glyoxylase-like metal-dependent hydrolase (beta-lactamase superfamily II)